MLGVVDARLYMQACRGTDEDTDIHILVYWYTGILV
jgi:hypothetical protein